MHIYVREFDLMMMGMQQGDWRRRFPSVGGGGWCPRKREYFYGGLVRFYTYFRERWGKRDRYVLFNMVNDGHTWVRAAQPGPGMHGSECACLLGGGDDLHVHGRVLTSFGMNLEKNTPRRCNQQEKDKTGLAVCIPGRKEKYGGRSTVPRVHGGRWKKKKSET